MSYAIAMAEQKIYDTKQKIAKRITAPEFRNALSERDFYRDKIEHLLDVTKEMKTKVMSGEVPHDTLRQKNFEYRECQVELMVIKDWLETYKNETAAIAAELSELEPMFDADYEGEFLGANNDCEKIATYDSGTREWLEQRQAGMGGSDIGSILMLHGSYSRSNYQRFLESKVEPITDEQVEQQTVTNALTGATGRGNAWEPVIVKQFSWVYPEYKTYFSKSTWRNLSDPRMVVNVDGLLASPEAQRQGTVDGILEIKTASDASKWEFGVPASYRAQVMWYMRATGFTYAWVAVLIDDIDYRFYYIEASETVEGDWNPLEGKTLSEHMATINGAWNEVLEIREKKEADQKIIESGQKIVEPKPKSLKVTFNCSAKSTLNSHIRRASAYRQESWSDTMRAFNEMRRNGFGDHEAMVELYRSFDIRTAEKDIVFIDLETDSTSYRNGDIIEFGAARYRPDGTLVSEMSRLYTPSDKRTLGIRGTGAQDVHNISVDMIETLTPFSDAANQAEIMEFIKGAIPSYHNASFENMWLSQHLVGFANERGFAPAEIDTMVIAKHLDPKGVRNTLEDFVTSRGQKYVNAHRALDDAKMSAVAFFAWVEEFYNGDINP